MWIPTNKVSTNIEAFEPDETETLRHSVFSVCVFGWFVKLKLKSFVKISSHPPRGFSKVSSFFTLNFWSTFRCTMTNARGLALRKPALLKMYSSALILMDYFHLLDFINKNSFCQALLCVDHLDGAEHHPVGLHTSVLWINWRNYKSGSRPNNSLSDPINTQGKSTHLIYRWS